MTPSKPGRALTDADLEALDNGAGTVAIEQLAAVEVRALRASIDTLERELRRLKHPRATGEDFYRLGFIAGQTAKSGEEVEQMMRDMSLSPTPPAAAPVLTQDEIRASLQASVPNAQELNERLRSTFTLPERQVRLSAPVSAASVEWKCRECGIVLTSPAGRPFHDCIGDGEPTNAPLLGRVTPPPSDATMEEPLPVSMVREWAKPWSTSEKCPECGDGGEGHAMRLVRVGGSVLVTALCPPPSDAGTEKP